MARKTPFTFTLEPYHKEALTQWAREDERSASNVLRRLIDEEIKRRKAKTKQEATNGA